MAPTIVLVHGVFAESSSPLTGPVLLVGHSYGCVVTTNIAADAGDLVGLVYIAGFAPDSGESVQSIVERFPGSTLGQTLRTVPRRDGTADATIDPEHFHAQFAADVPATEAARMAVTQRPITLEALAGATGPDPLWKRVPSWFLLAGEDRDVPPDAIRFMAERAGARRLVEIAGASHAIAVSQPGPTAELILEAAQPPAVA